MCPLCLASLVGAIVAATTSTAAVGAVVVHKVRSKEEPAPSAPPQERGGTAPDRSPA
jgi:hypothetical protein